MTFYWRYGIYIEYRNLPLAITLEISLSMAYVKIIHLHALLAILLIGNVFVESSETNEPAERTFLAHLRLDVLFKTISQVNFPPKVPPKFT